jgi:transcriptional regulator with XRE-family HTH domain
MTAISEIRARYIQINGKKARELREAKHLSAEQLARAAGCNTKTILALEASKPKFKSTVLAVAKALHVAPEDLEPTPSIVNVRPADALLQPLAVQNTIEVTIRLSECNVDDPATLRIVLNIVDRAFTQDPIVIVNERPVNSVDIHLEMSEADGVRLTTAFVAGRLLEYRIDFIIILPDPTDGSSIVSSLAQQLHDLESEEDLLPALRRLLQVRSVAPPTVRELYWQSSSAKRISLLACLRQLGPDAREMSPFLEAISRSGNIDIRHYALSALSAIRPSLGAAAASGSPPRRPGASLQPPDPATGRPSFWRSLWHVLTGRRPH